MSAEEKVFTMPELRLYILAFLINPYECIICSSIPYYTKNLKKPIICELCDPYGWHWNEKNMELYNLKN